MTAASVSATTGPRTTCPTCRSTVGAFTGTDGTSGYIPIEDDHQVCEETVESLRTYCTSRIDSHERSLADPDPEDDSSPEWLDGFYTACKQMRSLIDSKAGSA